MKKAIKILMNIIFVIYTVKIIYVIIPFKIIGTDFIARSLKIPDIKLN